MYENLI